MWHRSKRQCESGACAEAVRKGDVVVLRSNLNPEVTVALRHDEWNELLIAMKNGDFDDVL